MTISHDGIVFVDSIHSIYFSLLKACLSRFLISNNEEKKWKVLLFQLYYCNNPIPLFLSWIYLNLTINSFWYEMSELFVVFCFWLSLIIRLKKIYFFCLLAFGALKGHLFLSKKIWFINKKFSTNSSSEKYKLLKTNKKYF